MTPPIFTRTLKDLVLSFAVGFVLASLALWFGWFCINPDGASWEQSWVLHFHQVPPQMLHVLAIITVVGYPLEIIAVLLSFSLWWWIHGARWKTTLLVTDTVLLTLIDYGAKPFFHRPRPNLFAHANLTSFAYPSGHALFLVGFYGAIAYLITLSVIRQTRVLIWGVWSLFALVIGFSRIALGVHWPTDVFAGYLSGSILLMVTIVARRQAFPLPSRDPCD